MELTLLQNKLTEVINFLKSDIGKIRTGRATPSLVENIVCPAYGGQQMLKVLEVATINVPDPQTLTIAPYDRSIIGDIKKGIDQANIGLTPVIDGDIIRINLPPLTAERREEYIKLLHTKLENARIMARQVRQEFMKQIDEEFAKKIISEDDKFRLHEETQKEIDKIITTIEDIGKSKEQELRRI